MNEYNIWNGRGVSCRLPGDSHYAPDTHVGHQVRHRGQTLDRVAGTTGPFHMSVLVFLRGPVRGGGPQILGVLPGQALKQWRVHRRNQGG